MATNTTEIYDPVKDEMNFGPELPHATYRHCFVKLSDTEYLLFGGYAGVYSATLFLTHDVYMYDTVTDTWTPKPNMPQTKAMMACGRVTLSDGRTVAVGAGGTDHQSSYNVPANYRTTSHFFEPATNQWSSGPLLPFTDVGMSGLVVDGIMHVFGGYSSNKKTYLTPDGSEWVHDEPIGAPCIGACWGITPYAYQIEEPISEFLNKK